MSNKNSFSQAYARWFTAHEKTRKARNVRPHTRIPDFPEPPPHPDTVKEMVENIGRRKVMELCDIHRSTLARWMTGDIAVPRACWSLLVLFHEGRLPGMSDDWRAFAFRGDLLVVPGTRLAYSASQILGWQYVEQALAASEARCKELERQLVEMTKRINWGSANDPYHWPGDVRARAFKEA